MQIFGSIMNVTRLFHIKPQEMISIETAAISNALRTIFADSFDSFTCFDCFFFYLMLRTKHCTLFNCIVLRFSSTDYDDDSIFFCVWPWFCETCPFAERFCFDKQRDCWHAEIPFKVKSEWIVWTTKKYDTIWDNVDCRNLIQTLF